MSKEPLYRQGVVSEVLFPNRGKMIPAAEDSAAGTASSEKNVTGPVTVKNVLPGQTVRVLLGRGGKRRREGRLVEILERAPYEQDAPCPHAGSCGGCSYQTLPYERQLALKEQQVKALLAPVLEGSRARFLPIAPSPLPFGYRNKMEFSFGDEEKDGPLTLGLHKRGAFHDILTTDHCMLVHPDLRKILRETLAYFTELGLPYVNKHTHTGYLRHLVLRRSFYDGSLLINLVTTDQASPDLTPWVSRLTSLTLEGPIRGILHTLNNSLADAVINEGTRLLYGEDHLREQLFGLTFDISPFSFFQTNSRGAETLYSVVKELAGDVHGQTIFDLYCGTGTIAQILSAAGASSVTGIEIVPEAVSAAIENARRNGLTNCSFLAGDVLALVDTLSSRPDLIVLDPPRDGIHPKALPKILEYAPERFLYISCKPTALVRDIPVFREAGYEPELLRPVDMFPQTVHVETVVLLSKRGAKLNMKPEYRSGRRGA